jgi:hypothetical protein
MQVAIATQLADGRYRLEIDDIKCAAESGWLTASSASILAESLEKLVERHDMRRGKVAVSLDGDFCVTRVAMGTTEEVDHELAMLADRVPRYLQLGPGEKVTGSSRLRIASRVDYAVTGVVNRNLIQMVYDALRSVDIETTWVEPSLVSVSRLVGEAKIGGECPVMIADGTGQQWDVGITCAGRLLLDYRPAAATTEEALRDALDGHISRLRRFCHRHRKIVSGELSQLLLCGSGQKLDRAVETLGDRLGIEANVLQVPDLNLLYQIDEADRDARCVPAIATVLPLLTGVEASDVPDLLTEVRRAPDMPWHRYLLRCGWPAAAALVVLCISFGLVASLRRQAARFAKQREHMETVLQATQARFSQLAAARELTDHLQTVQEKTKEADWIVMFEQITQSLPAVVRLSEIRVESDGGIHLEGLVLDETAVY